MRTHDGTGRRGTATRPGSAAARRRIVLVGLLAAALPAFRGAAGSEGHDHGASAPAGLAGGVQKTCPVMVGNAINPDIFTVYRGRKVYFCCPKCRAAFSADPQKYLSRLPQFAGTVPAGTETHEHGDGHGAAASLAVLVEPMGILTICLVAATVCLGVFRRLKPRPMLRIHKVCGVCALTAGAVHAALVLLTH